VQVDRYVGKISGPLLDRISIHVYVYPVEVSSFKDTGGDSSSDMRREVLDAREIARVRNRVHFRPGETDSCVGATPPAPNARLTEQQIKRFCRLDDPSETLLFNSQRRLHISARPTSPRRSNTVSGSCPGRLGLVRTRWPP
jgi:magnesium chelatase family protein